MPDVLDQSELKEKAHRLVAAAIAAGADRADAVAVRGVSLSVGVRLGEVEDSERSEGDDFGLRVFVGRRQATISANVFADPAGLAARAVAMARAAPEDPFADLIDPDLLTRDFVDLDLLDLGTPSAAELTARALATEDAARAVAGVSNSGGASASWSLGGLVLVTSHGFAGAWLGSRHALSVTALAGSGTAMERDWAASSKIFAEDLETPEEIGRRAGERAVRRLNPRQIDTRVATVVWEPRAATGLVGHLLSAINGAAVARRTSFLSKARETAVFAPGVTITDDPYRRRGLSSRPFDGEGVAGPVLNLVEDGILRHWLLDGASARELGLATNGRAARGTGSPSPGSTNVTLQPGPTGRDAMIRSIDAGLLVTDMIGSGVNGITGDYSRGASGFWIEKGEITHPVSEVTVAGNLIDMYARLVPADDLEHRFGIDTPSVMIEGLTIAGR
ncbi:TldD/PmbA family protein [Siculibacillus lacustris]|uniref:TldD/PmbA family protein n=1 Tax=Siculibacillus lacustris TaxID=1549641 RepID=A0A4Q9VID3_9HYPH|nr:TldD/PmbA family protein [Siculibacillus lacustris]TBW34985.1 TldD/PmbA family protein [Siculibacillus lacustris]